MSKRIVFFVFPGFQLLDLSGPLAAFQMAAAARPDRYHWSVMSEAGGAITCSTGLEVSTRKIDKRPMDTLIVVGGQGIDDCATSPVTVAYFKAAAGRAKRIASVCTGAFLLAAAGLLDGRRATTHWRDGARFQALHPQVRVEADKIFVRDGTIWTSAGITAGIDLALALIEEDYGDKVSLATARELVVYHRRLGNQSQFSALLELEPPSERIRAALHFAREHLKEPLSVERMAETAFLSTRQFSRLFRVETGQTPARAVERLRAEAARPRVESGFESLEEIAHAVGFSNPERMRQSFIRTFGQPPQALRRLARIHERVSR